jgi:hypothetical protein
MRAVGRCGRPIWLMRSPLAGKKALFNADPCVSESAGILIDDGPAHGETQAPLGVSDRSSARRCSVLQHGMAKLGVSSQQTRPLPQFQLPAYGYRVVLTL